jgi:hypothetical protein
LIFSAFSFHLSRFTSHVSLFTIFEETNHMGLPVNNKKAGKAGAAGSKNAAQASKFISKPGTKAVGVAKKPIKTGGSRGS